MVDDSGTALVREYMRAWPSDFDQLTRLRAADFVEDWPQSGERIHGDANYRAIHEAFPGGMPTHTAERISGTPDQWAVTPVFTLVHISGSGGSFTVEGTLAYPDGLIYKLVAVLELAGGKVRAQRSYFAPQMEAPDWRSQWVEHVQGGSQ